MLQYIPAMIVKNITEFYLRRRSLKKEIRDRLRKEGMSEANIVQVMDREVKEQEARISGNPKRIAAAMRANGKTKAQIAEALQTPG